MNECQFQLVSQMLLKSVFRIYLNTSKGSDSFLYRELLSFNTRPKYDEHMHAFYIDAPLRTLFDLSFRSLTAENMWIQMSKPFPAVNQQTFPQHLQNIQFKNYLPLKRGLIENMTVNILVRETQYPLSDRLTTTLLQNALEKEITKREYHQNIVKVAGGSSNSAQLPYSEIKEIVHRKWEQEDMIREEKLLKQLTYQHQEKVRQLPINGSIQVASQKYDPHVNIPANVEQAISRELAGQLPFHPNLTFYVRKNQGRLLLKLNKQEMYKHGWKKQVGWAPIRQTLVAAILNHTQILNQASTIKLWDPFCGSATIPIVAAAQFYSLKVRSDPQQNFVWPHWSIYKKEQLEEYLKSEQASNQQKIGKLKLICSDISFQAVNYTINNLKELDKSMLQIKEKQQNVKRLKPNNQIYELRQGEWAILCGDFEELSKNVLVGQEKVNIITNLPYTQSRSKEHIPLNQLISVYRRFNNMIQTNKEKIANVFVIVNSAPSEIVSPNHFLSLSTSKWQQVASFQSGGMPIGLYAWSGNVIKTQFLDTEAVKHQIIQKKHEIESIQDDSKIGAALVNYRQRIREIQKKNYFIPKHLLKFKKGWRRVVQKRRRRHLLRAYELFAKRRDKLMAFAEYSKKKLEVNMLRRGYIWRKRNMRLLKGTSIEQLEAELKRQFETRIQEALAKSEEEEKYKEEKKNMLKTEKEKEKEAKRKMAEQKYFARKGVRNAEQLNARKNESQKKNPKRIANKKR